MLNIPSVKNPTAQYHLIDSSSEEDVHFPLLENIHSLSSSPAGLLAQKAVPSQPPLLYDQPSTQEQEQILPEVLPDGRQWHHTVTVADEEAQQAQENSKASARPSAWWAVAGLTLTGLVSAAIGFRFWRNHTAQSRAVQSVSPGSADDLPAARAIYDLRKQPKITTTTAMPKDHVKIEPAKIKTHIKETPVPKDKNLCKEKVSIRGGFGSTAYKFVNVPCKSSTTIKPASEMTSPPAISTPPSSDDVKAVKMFSTDCLEPRNDMHFTDWLRAVGKALKSPFGAMAEESQVIHYYNTLGIGCPPPETVQHLQKIMQPIDYVVSTVLSIIPGMQPASVAQFIIGPGLELIADHLEGKAMDVDKLLDISIQTVSMMHATLPTLSAKEQVALYNKPQDKSEIYDAGKQILAKRFIFHDGKPHIKMDDKQLPFYVSDEGIPYIKDAEEKIQFIHYNHEVNRWEYSNAENAQQYSIDNLENAAVYSIPMSQLPEGRTLHVDNDGVITISSPGKDDMTGVFVAGKFVPAHLVRFDTHLAMTTNSPTHQAQRVLHNSDWGWNFEPPSMKMDRSLKTLLESKDKGITYTHGLRFSEINEDSGLSTDQNSRYYLKKDNQYFNVKKFFNKKIKKSTFSLPGYSHAKIKLSNGLVKVQQADELIFALRNKKVKNPASRKPFYIESQTFDYLKKSATTTSATPALEVAQGVYTDSTGHTFLMVGKAKFVARQYDATTVHIKRKNTSNIDSDIILWKDGDTYIRVRDENEKVSTNYKRYNRCRQVRSPKQSSHCLPMLIEDQLDAELTQHISRGTVNHSQPDPENLTEVNIFKTPVLYRDNKTFKYYFPYNNAWFETELVNKRNTPDALLAPPIKIYSKGNIFRRRKLIATLVAEKKDNNIEIKKLKTFLSEKTNVNNNIAELYASQSPFRQLANIASVEDMVSEARADNKPFVDIPLESETSVQPNISPAEHKWNAINSLFPQRISESNDYVTTISPLNTGVKVLTDEEQHIIEHIKDSLQLMADEIIPKTSFALFDDQPDWPAAAGYFENVMENHSDSFHSDVAYSLRKRLKKIEKIIKADNIRLVSRVPVNQEGQASFKIDSLLTPAEKETGKAVYVSPVDGKIYINMHKVDSRDPMKLISEILRETFHSKGDTKDFFNIPVDEAGPLPVLDAIDAMTESMQAETLTPEQEEALNDLSNKYLKTVSPYRRNKNTNLFKKGALAYLTQNDAHFRAHLLFHSSDFLTTFTQDIYYRLAGIHVENESPLINNWMKRYAETHQDIADRSIVMKMQPQRTGLAPERVMQTIEPIGDVEGESFLSVAKMDPQIADAISHPKQKCEAITIPVKDFMEKVGFKNIRYRAMAFFLHGGDAAPTNHFAVAGEKDDVTYVFDLTAHQFSSIYPELSGPLILPEEKWAQKYANLEGRTLIKYGDYKEMIDARIIFGPDSKYLSYGPGCKLPGAYVLKRPGWYFPGK